MIGVLFSFVHSHYDFQPNTTRKYLGMCPGFLSILNDLVFTKVLGASDKGRTGSLECINAMLLLEVDYPTTWTLDQSKKTVVALQTSLHDENATELLLMQLAHLRASRVLAWSPLFLLMHSPYKLGFSDFLAISRGAIGWKCGRVLWGGTYAQYEAIGTRRVASIELESITH